jgi:putative transposase
LIRSLGGWSEVKKMRLKGMDRIKRDERILGDSDFVLSVLSQANERFERRYELKRRGYDMTRVAERVAKKNARAREVYFARWCASELNLPQTWACPGTGDDGLRHRLCRKKRRNHRRARRLHVD